MSFTLIEEKLIPEINTRGKLYIHDQSGARLLSLSNQDENKVFGISFRTPPPDSSGLPHIMEHSVLDGSRKYPVKEPFVEIIKSSLQTFVNAFTYPDKTCYPVASQNLKDFYNLIDIYLDAVFYPLISENTLRQEGWHYEYDQDRKTLSYKGVVFNEMKGAYSSPDDLLGDRSRISLFPDNAYGLDSGGDPLHIPDLTYEQFKHFHDTYYHPSNSYIYFYGDDPEDERLRILDAWLNDFTAKKITSIIQLQPDFAAPLKLTYPYDSGDSSDAKAHLTINWLLPESVQTERTLALSILSHILLATPSSPLKRVLIQSGLGEEVSGGFEEQLRQTMFTAGLKGIQPENLAKVEQLIMETLGQLEYEGLDPETIAASLNTIEFQLREQNTGSFPRGLSMMLGALTTWLYDGNPFDGLAFEAPLQQVKENSKNAGYFESLIRKYLLDNPHRSTVMLIPDPAEGKRREALETERLAKFLAGISSQELEKIIAETAHLHQLQETPDSPENLASIPSLALEDIKKSVSTIPTHEYQSGKVRILHHDLFTNGIIYLDLGFDLHSVPQDLLPYSGLFGQLLLEMGTEKENFIKLNQRIGRETGGIRPAPLNSMIRGQEESAAWLFMRGKTTTPQANALLEILKDILLTTRFDQPERFQQIALERKSNLEASLIPGGSGVVNQRLKARFNSAGWLAEKMNGIDQLFFLRELTNEIEHDWKSVLAKLEALADILINQAGMIANVTSDAASFLNFQPLLNSFIENIPQKNFEKAAWEISYNPKNEGLTIPAQVNYVGKGSDLYRLGYELHGSAHVINKYLQTTWLWEKIRVQGGAYGGHSAFDPNSGVFNFVSYRDPNLLSSLEIYDATSKFLLELDLSGEELKKAIIGTIGDLDAYLLPDAKGWTAMNRILLGIDDAQRQQIRDEVLQTRIDDFRNFGRVLAAAAQKGEVVVLGSADEIEKANRERKDFLVIRKVL